MISVEDACARILAAVQPLSPIDLALRQAYNSYAAADLFAKVDLPGFDNSAMDGYAVRFADLKTASAESPVILQCIARIAAGEHLSSPISAGQCARVFTGSMMPEGADAVVMQEDVVLADGGGIRFVEAAKPLENVRLRGEDVRKGSKIVSAGEKLTAARLGLLAASGHASASVHRGCRVALLATGSELSEPGVELRPGGIYESNRTMLGAFLAPLKCGIDDHPIVRDDLQSTIAALRTAFGSADLVVSSGGVSVGEYDFVKQAFQALGGSVDLWQIAMRPGKPFTFGQVNGKFLFGLPGNPVSAFVTFLLLVRPAILKMHGARNYGQAMIEGELAESIVNRGDRRHFVRVRFENGKIYPAGGQKSHMIGSLSQANALLDVAPGAELKAASRAKVILWELPQS
jgi:molybdopterin molybdotransferase